jgi:sporulation-control protein spo0M
MPAQISFQLDKPNYHPGEMVHGTVHLIAGSDLRPRGVLLHAFGEEVTTLGPNTLMTQHSHPFDLTFNLWSPTAHEDKLYKGEHDFAFEFALPTPLPPSFNGEFTRIVYLIEAKVDLPLHADVRHEQALHILPAPLTAADQPVRASAASPQGGRLELALNASGYYPGEHVLGTLRVTGMDQLPLTAATIELISHETGEAREFTDHFDKVRVRVEIDPAQLIRGQPFPIDLPIPEDADPSFVAQHSAKSRLVRAKLESPNIPPLNAEAVINIGVK